MRELNIREENDPNYMKGMLEINDEIEALIYQIKMPLGTNKGEVLGEPDFGCDLDSMLFSSDFYIVPFTTIVTDQVRKFSELATLYPVTVNAYNYGDDPYRSTIMLDIAINGKSAFGFLYGD